MAVECDACHAWMTPAVDRERPALVCSDCGHAMPIRLSPLFIVTGASGTGKTAIVAPLQRLLPDWDVFDTNVLWDSGNDPETSWHFARSNWLRIAFRLAQAGRRVILCGTQVPEKIDRCDHRPFFSAIHYLNLHADDETRDARLRARPAWRGCTNAFIEAQRQFAAWLLANAETAFDPPLVTVDTTRADPETVARRVRDWAVSA